jgi:2-polyprenyl-3-methyl-5-hydroxy-6-metoxy-1,4-benzoquinol methylase
MPSPSFHCLYCDSADLAAYTSAQDSSGHRRDYFKCAACQTVSLLPLPTAEELREAYSDAYYGEAKAKFVGPVERVINRFRGQRSRHAAKFLQTGDTLVDIGCGNGQFLSLLRPIGKFRLYGVELPGKAAERAKQLSGLTIKEGELVEGDFPAGSVAVVTMFHVFEHLSQPRQTLRLIHQILAPQGALIISFPNSESAQANLFKKHWLHLDPPRHLALFGSKNFIGLAKAEGFALQSQSSWSLEQNPFGFIQSLLNTVAPGPRDLLYEFLKGNRRTRQGGRFLLASAHLILAALLAPLAVLEELLTAPFGRGATVQFVFRKA